jgi:lipid-binding SYLF domain-containing protein
MMQERQLTSHEQVFSPAIHHAGASAATPASNAAASLLRPTTSPHPLSSAVKSHYHPTGSVAVMPPIQDATISLGAENNGVSALTGDSMVQSARKEWKRHGSALTQDLEETRRRDEERPGTVTVRLMSAENRRDVTNQKYTSYVLRVKLANNQVLQLEHRYSEFVKLNEAFNHHGVHLDAAFPPKHLAGRIGNWQLAKRWAPDQHEELVKYRKVQLDVWLVAVTAKYNLGDLPHSLARSVYEFLTLSNRPPCDMENTMVLAASGSAPSSMSTYSQNSGSTVGGSYSKKNMLRWNNPISFTLGSSIRQACQIVEKFCMASSDQSIPLDLLQCAKGLIFLTVIKAGFMVSGRIGTGLLVARVDGDDNQKWSAPCALGTIGMGWGMLAGGDITHYLVVLTTQDAVETMLSGTVQLGTEIGVAMGPVGRMTQFSASASNTEWTLHPAYSYAHSKGLFMGMSIEGAVLSTRNDVNAKFYGRSGLTGADLVLDGHMPPPKAAEPLYMALERALATDIPEDRFRPSQLFQEQTTAGVISNSNGNQNVITIDEGFFAPVDTIPSSFVPTAENDGGANAPTGALSNNFYRPS